MNRVGLIASFLVGLSIMSANAAAEISDLSIHGFADLVAAKTSTVYPLNSINNVSDKPQFDAESRLGLNLSSNLGENLDFASQIVGRGTGKGNYALRADWIFATYKPLEGLAIRAGRQINPAFLYSEQIDVGFTYIWTRLPFELYGLYPLNAFNGIGLLYTIPLGQLRLRTEVYGGGGSVTIETPNSVFNGSANDEKGIELTLEGDAFKVRAGYSAANPNGTIEIPVPVSGGVYGTLRQNADLGTAQLFSAGGSYDGGGIVAVAEYGHSFSTGTLIHNSVGGYVSAGYHLGGWLPYMMYSWQTSLEGSAYAFPDQTVSTTPRTGQDSDVVGVRYQLGTASVLKFEGMRTAEIFNDSSRNFTANTFTASMDMVF